MTSERRGDDGLLFLVWVGAKGMSPLQGEYDHLPRFVIPANAGIQRGASIDGKPFVHPKRLNPAGKAMGWKKVAPSEI